MNIEQGISNEELREWSRITIQCSREAAKTHTHNGAQRMKGGFGKPNPMKPHVHQQPIASIKTFAVMPD